MLGHHSADSGVNVVPAIVMFIAALQLLVTVAVNGKHALGEQED